MCQTNVFSFLIFDFALGRKQEEKQLTPAEGAVSFTLHRLCSHFLR